MGYRVGETVAILETPFEGKVEAIHPNFEESGSTAYAVRMPRAAIDEGFADVEIFDWTALGLPEGLLVEQCKRVLIAYFEQFAALGVPSTYQLQRMLIEKDIHELSDRAQACGNQALALLRSGEKTALLKMELAPGDFPGDMDTVPGLLLLDEEGDSEPPYDPFHSRDEEERESAVSTSDDDAWVQTGWRARTPIGTVIYRHNEKGPVMHFLTLFGYQDTGDGCHYQRAS
jgi:hypothetical protein